MKKKTNFVQYIELIKNSLKFSIIGSIFPFLFCIFLIILRNDFTENMIIYLFVFILTYILDLVLNITKWSYKTFYWRIYGIFSLILIWSILSTLELLKFSIIINKTLFLFNINYLFNEYVILLTIFIISQRFYYYIQNIILPFEKQIKTKRYFYQKYVWLKEQIMYLKLEIKSLFIINILLTLFLILLYFNKIIKFDTTNLISFGSLLQTNATIYALILTVTVAILGTNTYLRKIYSSKILFSGVNFLFFISYTILILFCLLHPTNILFILTLFMLINTFIFMMHLFDNQKIGYIINILNKVIFENIDKKIFNPYVISTKSSFFCSGVKGTVFESGSTNKHEDFKSAFDNLEELAIEAEKNGDKQIFVELIKNYFVLGRYFLYRCDEENKNYLTVYLTPIWKIYKNSKLNEEYKDLIIETILDDYICPECCFDIKTWNLERFRLMSLILQITSEKEKKEYIISRLIEMIIIRMMERTTVIHNGFSNQSYKNFKNTDEFKELKKTIKKYKISWKSVEELPKLSKFEDSGEQHH